MGGKLASDLWVRRVLEPMPIVQGAKVERQWHFVLWQEVHERRKEFGHPTPIEEISKLAMGVPTRLRNEIEEVGSNAPCFIACSSRSGALNPETVPPHNPACASIYSGSMKGGHVGGAYIP